MKAAHREGKDSLDLSGDVPPIYSVHTLPGLPQIRQLLPCLSRPQVTLVTYLVQVS